ncbi:GNAT family N-acetyltransferase [Chitinimonas naiadis]
MHLDQPNEQWTIVEYLPEHEAGVIDLILTIQNVEANLDISIDQQPDLLDIAANYTGSGGGFWVALSEGGGVIGSIGLQYGTETVGILKKFFVEKAYRGADIGVASALFDRLIEFANARDIQTVILDTPALASRSHTFYRKKGFRQIEKSAVPIHYDYPDRGSLLFRLDL